ncbi:MAG: DUF3313 family protein [Planctomycetaceae bacterium]|nr:DUF3313 family protein [Planctomycetaceae bacterium]
MSGSRNVLLGLLLLSITPGCIHMHPTRSGFLSDYSGMQPLGKRDKRLVQPVAPGALAEVDSFYIEPVTWLADDLGQPVRDPRNAEHIRDSLEVALAKELGAIRPVVTEIGPQTARVRAAVTGVQEAKPLMNMILLVQIVGPLFNGGAVAEIEVIDPNGVQIAAESVAYRGYDWDVLGLFKKRTHPESAMRRAARQLAGDLTVGDATAIADDSEGCGDGPF